MTTSSSSLTVAVPIMSDADASAVPSRNDDTMYDAIYRDDLEAVRFFVEEEGMDVDCTDDFAGFTPLTVAARNGSFDLVRYLLSKNANVEGYSSVRIPAVEEDSPTVEQEYPVEAGYTMAAAWRRRNREMVKVTIRTNGDLMRMTPLMAAAMEGHSSVVEILLEQGRRVNVNDMDRNGNTALILALEHPRGHCIVETLLRHGANTNPPRPQEMQNPPLLYVLRHRGVADTVRLLLDHGANIDARDKDCDTALHTAIMYSDEETVRLLIARGANIHTQGSGGLSPLSAAASTLNSSMVRVLLEHGATVDMSNYSVVKSVLHYAAGSDELCAVVLNHCRRMLSESDLDKFLVQKVIPSGQIALHCVKTVESAKLLIEQLRRQDKHLLIPAVCHAQLMQKDRWGWTPRMQVTRSMSVCSNSRGYADLGEYLESFESLPLSIPVQEATGSSSTPPKKKKLTAYCIAVKLNPALNDFQRSVAEEAAQLIMGTTGLPDCVAFAVLGCLVPLDVMKRSANQYESG